MEENNIIGTCLVLFFSSKDGRNFVVLKKEKGRLDFLGGLMKKGESAAEAVSRQAGESTSIGIFPDVDNGEDFVKNGPIPEFTGVTLFLKDDNETESIMVSDLLLSYLGSYWNTAKQVFNPGDKSMADWIISYVVVTEMEEELDSETVSSLVRLKEGGDDLAIFEIEENKKPEFPDNYQMEIYNNALDYLRRWLNVSYGLIP